MKGKEKDMSITSNKTRKIEHWQVVTLLLIIYDFAAVILSYCMALWIRFDCKVSMIERYRERLSGVDGIQLNCVQDDVKSNYAYFPVVFEERLFGASRAEVFDRLAENGIGARKYFYPLTNTFECFHGKYDVTKTPVALHISKRVLTLPLYADLALEDVDRICDIILDCKC